MCMNKKLSRIISVSIIVAVVFLGFYFMGITGRVVGDAPFDNSYNIRIDLCYTILFHHHSNYWHDPQPYSPADEKHW